MVRYAVAALIVLAACTDEVVSPPSTAPLRPAAAIAAPSDDSGPPPPHRFGPDSYRVGIFTGQGITQPGLSCDKQSPEVRVCSGFLASAVDGARLDVTLQIPLKVPKPVPLVVLGHGYGGSKTSSGDIALEL